MWLVWYFLSTLALLLSVLAMIFITSKMDSKIKAGSFHIAVLRASLVMFAALAVCSFPLFIPFTLANVQHNWWRYLAPLVVVPGTLGEWNKVRQLWRQQHTEPPLDVWEVKQ